MYNHKRTSLLTWLLTLLVGAGIVLLILGEASGLELPGDVDCSGESDSRDALLILQLDAGIAETVPCQYLADINLDGAVNSVDATLILQAVAALIPAPTPRTLESIPLEAESGTGAGQTMPRSNASKSATVWLHTGETRSMVFKLSMAARYAVEADYSNDGLPDTLEVRVDGAVVGQFTTTDTRPGGGVPGSGWNVFNRVVVGTADLSAGDHDVEVTVMEADSFGVEIDLVRLERLPPATPTAISTPPPTATSTLPPTATSTPPPMATSTSTPTATSTATLEPLTQLLLEAESGTGAGQTKPRGSASNMATVLLFTDETRSMTFNLPTAASYDVEAAYSNDGLPDTVEVSIDGVVLGQFVTKDTRPDGGVPGSGWNVFNSTMIGTADLSAGDHKVEVTVTASDSFGVEIDVLRLDRAD